MSNNTDEVLIDLDEAANISPGRPSRSTVWRWARYGIKLRNGQAVRLEHVIVGKKLHTSRQWLQAFWKNLADASISSFEQRTGRPLMAPTSMPSTYHVSRELREEGL